MLYIEEKVNELRTLNYHKIHTNLLSATHVDLTIYLPSPTSCLWP